MGVKGNAEIKKSEDISFGRKDEMRESIICNIVVAEDSNLLIGQHGVNLQSLQHIVRLILRNKIEEKINLVLDVNSYREQKNKSIIGIAREAARQAIEEKRAMVLKPMSAYERRLVHLELSKNDEVITESVGEGEDRKIIVKPAKIID
jgi:spoIIIJ-associated protein